MGQGIKAPETRTPPRRQRVDLLLLSDPVLYTWLHWEMAYAKERLGYRLEITRTDDPLLADTVTWRMRFGFDNNRRDDLPFVVPPH